MEQTQQPKMSDEAVLQASGKTWSQWFSEMESKGFLELSRKEVVKRLNDDYMTSPEWAQTIAAEFERVNGARKTNGHKDGFEVSVSKTFPYPVDDVYDRALQWFEKDNRAFLRPGGNVKKLHCDWLTDDSHIAVRFNSKGKGKTQIVVQHENLLSEGDVEVMRNFWKERLEHLVESL